LRTWTGWKRGKNEMTREIDHKDKSRGVSCDMSPEAIARRIRIVSELRALSLRLGQAKKVTEDRPQGTESSPALKE
jgi:hypothetical protein